MDANKTLKDAVALLDVLSENEQLRDLLGPWGSTRHECRFCEAEMDDKGCIFHYHECPIFKARNLVIEVSAKQEAEKINIGDKVEIVNCALIGEKGEVIEQWNEDGFYVQLKTRKFPFLHKEIKKTVDK